ncbi:hypothetical protein BD626DRAFT_565705 [Schizophyllum amplum]|uniref:valine--tRNA ligase n=1 Tax=Schizophyllum amplum TaxID=97359 RepID=A0A550CP79_9AGAR|nr:hypothetical protein BD626DRAFT_565705 [Auriculariopsis ampla]
MGWPQDTADFRSFYPSNILETGWDILFFWVARMVMLGTKLTGKMLFREVYCPAMIRDAHGRKMSKSLGNVIDLLDVIRGCELEKLCTQLLQGNLDEKEIKKAKEFNLRFALCAYSGGGRDINLEILRVEGYRKFCNKIFNVTKFAMLKLDESFVPAKESLVECWVLHKLNVAAKELNAQMADRNSMMATTGRVQLLVEAMKPMTDESAFLDTKQFAQQTLYTCLDHGLRLLHPFMPFVTEELWQRLPRRPNDATPTIMLSKFPEPTAEFVFDEADRQFDLVFSMLKTGRLLPASYNLQSDIHLHLGMIALTKGCKSAKVGLVDLDVEIAKCDKKLDVVRLAHQKIVKTESQADNAQNVPENVRTANVDKRMTLEAEIATLELSTGMFAKLK